MSPTIDTTNSHELVIEDPKLKLTDSQKERLKGLITTELSKGSARDLAIQEIKHLAHTIISIESDFATIKDEVKKIDDQKILFNSSTKQALQFLPEWSACHDEYTSLILATQETATTGHNQIKTFIHDIIPTVTGEGDIKDKEDILKTYIQNIKHFKETGENDETRLLRLRQKIEAFQKNITATITEDISSVNGDLKTIVAKIKVVQGEVERLDAWFEKYYSTLTDHGVSHGTVGLMRLSPRYMTQRIVEASTGSSEAHRKSEERLEQRLSLEKLKHDETLIIHQTEPALQSTMTRVTQLGSTFTHLTGQLNAIHSVWRLASSSLIASSSISHIAINLSFL
ncbi:hypothetical protein CVT24_008090 [Panaeolus cyanescens]|uniref:Uncharacterized protein n=1 Tax=Panaeolus cyanescens TaxID=181874 RepID=A0A409YLK2_9AGAR|nr:hypothetical protein CVT24_008090 [Panaeolus cyanescens]